MTELVTRCPDCHVAFRASRAQLRAAGGRVRCGACFSVFNGRDNLVTPPAPLEPDDAPTAPGEKTGPAQPRAPDRGAPISPKVSSKDAPEEPPEKPPEEPPERATETTPEPAPELILEPGPPPETDTPPTPAGEDDEQHELDQPESAEPSPQVPLPLEAPEPARERPPEQPRAIISELAETPTTESQVPDAHRPPLPPGRKNWPWTVLLVLASLALALQLLHFRAENLPPTADHRAAWATFCRFAGCRLPVLEDRSRIEVRNLVVRSHPDYRDALLVDVILVNNAGFRQPFPPLVLEFSDLQGTPVARRLLQPGDYLAGEAGDMETMPSDRPIHLELELLDPGAEAVSYRLDIPYQ